MATTTENNDCGCPYCPLVKVNTQVCDVIVTVMDDKKNNRINFNINTDSLTDEQVTNISMIAKLQGYDTNI